MNPVELQDALNQCVRCGRCLSACPIYGLTLKEGSAARGKLALLRADLAGRDDLASKMKNLLSHCLLCGACAEVCASGVRGDELIQAGRSMALGRDGLARLKSLLAGDLMVRGPLTRSALKGRRFFLKNMPPESGLHFRFPLPGLDPERHLPALADKPFLETVRQRVQSGGSGPRVALFVGCVANFMRPQAAEAAVRVLEAAGARVSVPLGQVCCGKPALGAGDEAAARRAVEANIRAFRPDDYDYLTAFCATCSEQLKHYESLSGPDRPPGWAGRVIDLNELLVRVLGWTPPGSGPDRPPLRVFYHDPCHLRRKQGVHREPRQLLRSLPDVELVGAEAPAMCCGYGGVFNLWHYDQSRALFRKRLESIAPLAPDRVVTTCSGCMLQFEDGLRRESSPPGLSTLIELVAERGLPAV